MNSPYRLYGTILNHLATSRGDLLLWDGSLSAVTAASTLETVASPFLQDSASTERDLALVALHERHRFNNEVVFGALCRPDILFLKHGSSILRQSSNPVFGYSMIEQVRGHPYMTSALREGGGVSPKEDVVREVA